MAELPSRRLLFIEFCEYFMYLKSVKCRPTARYCESVDAEVQKHTEFAVNLCLLPGVGTKDGCCIIGYSLYG